MQALCFYSTRVRTVEEQMIIGEYIAMLVPTTTTAITRVTDRVMIVLILLSLNFQGTDVGLADGATLAVLALERQGKQLLDTSGI